MQQIDVYCISNKAIALYMHVAIDILYNVVKRTVIPNRREGRFDSDVKGAGILICKLELNP